ncbi:class I SAM-dependent DNA methyltransferase [Acetobacter peroxydans]|jgi:type I restriction enzyme M protein|uniref:site-specific DNA-methyltransferase (adenine-specific) n=1 Tax=Acetobacter peroxydans TaxID=104098 RepID=A0A4Y3TRP5_9PROT|nr:class I SAM-dependent DNA methyltransferase [Acetobacter peroxydans]NHO16209.1 N-6 DNA methylase [Acetobacter peroxydans]GBR31796.1 type I DNA methyltransferase M subunit HsdM [Acetobacter peroxydans NBRC 13755]GBR40692.1 type I DNA methyltransferase M subunit HsdM [Acetobacter peroxydans]GEB85701.1 DNA methyltransferase [Acetobacter peroxydans]
MPRGRPRKNPDAAPAPKKTTKVSKAKAASATLGFEQQMFLAADKLRKNLEPSDYKHVALGLIFLRYISTAFEARHAELMLDDPAAAEDPDEYLAENIFWVPETARWSHLRDNARSSGIGKLIDDAMLAIEKANPEQLKGVLPKDYGRPALDSVMLGELIDLISDIGMGDTDDKARDVLGRVYEYFLGGFAGAEGKRGGEFYTPSSVVRTLVSMLEPYKGRVYDPCCGSGGMFVQSERFVETHGGKLGDIAIYGQESNHTTWRLARMNLAVRGIGADIRWNNEGSFLRDELKDLRFDYILANPPFNVSDWWNASLEEDPRWQYGKPPAGNANYAWLQHILWHLAPDGTAGVVLANGSMSSNQNSEGEIRRRMVEADVVDCMVALPGQLFYSTQIPACLWFLTRTKKQKGWRDRRGEILFIDARKLGKLVDRTRRELTDEDVARIADTYHAWRGEKGAGTYEDIPGFCKSATLDEVEQHGFVLTPGRYVGAEEAEEDNVPFTERFAALEKTLKEQFAQGEELNAKITTSLKLIVQKESA